MVWHISDTHRGASKRAIRLAVPGWPNSTSMAHWLSVPFCAAAKNLENSPFPWCNWKGQKGKFWLKPVEKLPVATNVERTAMSREWRRHKTRQKRVCGCPSWQQQHWPNGMGKSEWKWGKASALAEVQRKRWRGVWMDENFLLLSSTFGWQQRESAIREF